jgi:hypothetical protein
MSPQGRRILRNDRKQPRPSVCAALYSVFVTRYSRGVIPGVSKKPIIWILKRLRLKSSNYHNLMSYDSFQQMSHLRLGLTKDSFR